MPNPFRALPWIRDITRIIVLDRFHPERRRLSQEASTACRSLSFHARCKIPSLPLPAILAAAGASPVETVLLPGPSTRLGDVGSPAGYHVLGALAGGLQPRTILEFGTYLGVSTLALALNTPPACRIFTVDLPDDASGNSVPELNALDQHHVSTSRHRVGEAFLGASVEKKIVSVRADSMSFQAETVVPSADLVYVDGGHSLPVIEKDTANAFKVLSPEGTIVWDDYFHLYPDVVKFLDALAEEHRLVGIAGTNYVIFSRRWRPDLLKVSV